MPSENRHDLFCGFLRVCFVLGSLSVASNPCPYYGGCWAGVGVSCWVWVADEFRGFFYFAGVVYGLYGGDVGCFCLICGTGSRSFSDLPRWSCAWGVFGTYCHQPSPKFNGSPSQPRKQVAQLLSCLERLKLKLATMAV